MFFSFFRKLPHFRGKFRLAHLLFREKLEVARDVFVQGKWNCKYVLPNLKEPVAFDIFVDGVYEPETIRFIVNQLPQNGTFLDLGMNIGAISIPVKTLRPDVKIIGVEAAPWVYDRLMKNLQLNGMQDVIVLNKALYDRDDENIEFYSPADAFGKGSLSPVFTKEGVSVSTIKLDTLIRKNSSQPVNFIKIDVEGFESFVFKGGAETLQSNNAPDILFEFVDWAEEKSNAGVGAAQRILLDFGYTIYPLAGSAISNDTISKPVIKGSFMFFATKRSNKREVTSQVEH